MQTRPLRTTVIGSYPFSGMVEFACKHLDQFGRDDIAELQEDAVITAVHDQLSAGLDVITDGEQTRLDFNLSFYGYLEGLELEGAPPRLWGPPAHDQRGKHAVTGELRSRARARCRRGVQTLHRIFQSHQKANPPASRLACLAIHFERACFSRYERHPDRYALTEPYSRLCRRELISTGRKRMHGDHRR
jgi:5-methyltetrahydropteroyltriglutamate--homocysteine methyltransferase